ncbi:NRDE family protein [Roseospirillum parvum]|uniref:Uncharacterized conserved protein, contains NRDE domain n=1 Tax=Roseospirillum parvum TaxID=83401 RepID=A0A1G7ULH8_9PROT|nr:NRDE family protein [Roseospirillum parvum]SDG48347.1 Uncharacterized conserved protein, contains NRDE domain [Roseospirillum parvum]
MCTVVLLVRPGHDWPLLLAGNRDEMADRPWRAPARHWPDRPHVVGGLDVSGGGSWLALNDAGVVATVLNRAGTLGPAVGKRTRGELVLEALEHAEAAAAAEALADLDPDAFRPFNLVVADAVGAFLVTHRAASVEVTAVPPGLHLLTAHELNDSDADPRIARHLPRFRAAPAPRPGPDPADWGAWPVLLAETGDGPALHRVPGSALSFQMETGFGTRSSALIALPADPAVRPLWLGTAGPPEESPFRPLDLDDRGESSRGFPGGG